MLCILIVIFMYSYCYVCSLYCLCVNVYCTTATGCRSQLQLTNISYSIHLFEALTGKVVQILVPRKISQVLVRYHRTHESEETDWFKLQLLCQGRSIIMPMYLYAMLCKLSPRRKHDLQEFPYQGLTGITYLQ